MAADTGRDLQGHLWRTLGTGSPVETGRSNESWYAALARVHTGGAMPPTHDQLSHEDLEAYQALDLALRVGEVLLSSGAGAADVAAQMLNVTHACGLRRATADVTFTELAVSYQAAPDEPALIQLRQVRRRVTDYEDLTATDHVVRDLLAGDIDRREASARLARVVSTGHTRSRWAVAGGNGVMSIGVAMMLRGNVWVAAIAFLAAVLIDLMQRRMTRARLPAFYQQVAGGMLATLLAAGVAASPVDVAPGRVITASIIVLLAGVNFMGAIQDALTGYPLTAGARILEAILSTAGVIAGVSGGLSLASAMGIRVATPTGVSAFSALPVLVVGGAVTAAAFAFASYAPYRSLLPVALIGAAATLTFALVYDRDLGLAWASTAGAVLVGLVSYAAASRVRVPTLVIVVSAVVPLLPGLSIYRGLTQLAEGRDAGLLSMVTAAAVAIGLSAGVFLGEYVAQPVQRDARRIEGRLAGPRLVGPMLARTRVRTRRRRRRARESGGSEPPITPAHGTRLTRPETGPLMTSEGRSRRSPQQRG